MSAAAPHTHKVTLKQGTCSWTDESLVKCGRFYPRNCTTARDRLEFYAKNFPCVEVDTSNYAIPQKKSHEEWLKAAPDGFIFHFKAYGLLTLLSVPTASLPWQVRDELPEIVKLKESVNQSDLGDALVQRVFEVQNDAFAKFFDAGKLGVIVFQFQANVKLADDSWTYVLKCRELLDKRFTMAVEFRSTSWVWPQANLDITLKRCRDHGLLLIGVDELIESEQSKYKQSLVVVADSVAEEPVGVGLPPKKLFICTQSIPDQVFLRVHRRVGEERRLSAVELQRWHRAICDVAARATAPTTIWMLWNSNYEDHSQINAAELAKLFDKSPLVDVLDWKATMRERETSSKKSILSFFASAPKKEVVAAAAVATTSTKGDADADDDETDPYDDAAFRAAAAESLVEMPEEQPSSSASTTTLSKNKDSGATVSPAKKARKEAVPDAKQPQLNQFFKKK